MIDCFDTSAVNRLHDDPERIAIVRGLLSMSVVRVTALNVIEVGGTADAERRESLLRLLGELAPGVRPLASPTALVRILAKAHADGNDRPIISLPDEENGIWAGLNNPEGHNEETRQEVLRWKQELEGPFRKAHETARPVLREFFTSREARPEAPSDVIRHYCNSEDFLHEIVAPLYLRATGHQLERAALRDFFSQIRSWPLYFSGWAYAIYERAIQDSGYGHKGKAGTVDLSCAVYLPFCDRFLTDDVGQRKALRLVNVHNSREPRTRVLSYEDFRRRLLVL